MSWVGNFYLSYDVLIRCPDSVKSDAIQEIHVIAAAIAPHKLVHSHPFPATVGLHGVAIS